MNVEERFSEMPKQEDLVSNGSDNLFAPDIDGELYADGEFSGAQNSVDPRVRDKSGFYLRLKKKAIVFIHNKSSLFTPSYLLIQFSISQPVSQVCG